MIITISVWLGSVIIIMELEFSLAKFVQNTNISAIGSPVSVVVANIHVVMEHIKDLALKTSLVPVDRVEEMLIHINSLTCR